MNRVKLEDESGRRDTLLAGFYALYLRHCGYDADETAELVMLRYPRLRLTLIQQRRERREEQAAAAAGGAA